MNPIAIINAVSTAISVAQAAIAAGKEVGPFVTAIKRFFSGEEITQVNGFKAWMPRAQFSQMCRLGQNLKRFTGGEQTYNGGFQAFTYGNLTVAVCLEIDEDRSYFTQDSNTFIVEEMPWRVYDLDGLQLRMKAGPGGNGSDAYNGAIGSQWNLGLYLPNNATLIKRASVSGLPTQVAAYQ